MAKTSYKRCPSCNALRRPRQIRTRDGRVFWRTTCRCYLLREFRQRQRRAMAEWNRTLNC